MTWKPLAVDVAHLTYDIHPRDAVTLSDPSCLAAQRLSPWRLVTRCPRNLLRARHPETSPPELVESDVSPAFKDTTPPAPLLPVPTRTETEPPRPDEAKPVLNSIVPEFPAELDPVVRASTPLTPPDPLVAVLTRARPLEVEELPPDSMIREPPEEAPPAPALTSIEPPSPADPSPACAK